MSELSRRTFIRVGAVGAAALWLPACGEETPVEFDEEGWEIEDENTPALLPEDGKMDETPRCEETESSIEGPFYKPGAPSRSLLVERGMVGTRLSVSGWVVSSHCQAIPGAQLDFWQADAYGRYDNVGYRLRGRFDTSATGYYRLRTVLPGRYPDGGTYRPRHLHVKVTAPGYQEITTQLYFQGDPFNDSDPFLFPSLVMPVRDTTTGGKATRFLFVLAPEPA
jgi:protocatechuate 3,4-dioxygenase beta subunit